MFFSNCSFKHFVRIGFNSRVPTWHIFTGVIWYIDINYDEKMTNNSQSMNSDRNRYVKGS